MDVAARSQRRAGGEADPHESPSHLSPMPDDLWTGQGLRQLPTCPLQEMRSLPAGSDPGGKRSQSESQSEGQGGRRGRGHGCWDDSRCGKEAKIATPHHAIPDRGTRSDLQNHPAAYSAHLSPLPDLVPRRFQRVFPMLPRPLQEVSS